MGRFRSAWDALRGKQQQEAPTARDVTQNLSGGFFEVTDLVDVDDFSKFEKSELRERSVELYRKGDPMARGILNVYLALTLGGGVRVSVNDSKLKEAWDRFARLNRWQAKVQAIITRTYLEGESFVRIFGPRMTDENSPIPRMTIVSSARVKEIQTDPRDFEAVQAYRIEDPVENKDERVPAEEIIHTRFDPLGTSARGWPLLAPVLKDIKRYEQWLTTRMLLNVIRASIPLEQVVEGDAETIAARAKEFTQMPDPGSVVTHGSDTNLKFPELNLNASDTSEDGDRFLARIAQGVGINKSVLKHAIEQNRFTKSLDPNSPMVMMFEGYRSIYEEAFTRIVRSVLGESAEVSVDFQPLVTTNLQSEAQGVAVLLANKVISPSQAMRMLGYSPEDMKEEISRDINWLTELGVDPNLPGTSVSPDDVMKGLDDEDDEDENPDGSVEDDESTAG